jgi:malate dehydrogenase
MARFKISLIGSGNIGGTMAHILSLKDCYEVVLFDVHEGTAKGKALDLSQSGSVSSFDGKLSGTNDYSKIAGSHAIIVTAGIPRKPGMSRDDLIKTNAGVISEVAKGIKKYAPDAFVIVVTNPLDVMVYHLWKESGLSPKKVVGMAGVLDSARFAYFLSSEIGVSVEDIKTFVLGGHGDTMVPMINYTSIAGIPLSVFVEKGVISKERLAEIVQRTRDGGAEIVKLLERGSAFYSPAVSAIEMMESYLFEKNRILPCAVMLNGEYGYKDIFVGAPCIISKEGVSKVLEIPLTEEEKDMLKTSVKAVEELMKLL